MSYSISKFNGIKSAKANEACSNAKDEEGGGRGARSKSNDPVFRFALAFSSLAILSALSTIINKYEKKEDCEQSEEDPLKLFLDIVHCFFFSDNARVLPRCFCGGRKD